MSDDEHVNKRVEKPISETARYWKVMNFYERFEQIIALLLSFIIAIIIMVALFRLIHEVMVLLIGSGLNPLKFEGFQGLFGMIMTLLIAMEFKHSIIRVIHRKVHIIQVKTVLMIAQLALARKFIILDFKTTSATEVFSLGFVVLAIAIAHWLLRERDRVEKWDETP
ncbi:hypothetical protein VagYM19_22970 [Vibrio alginolyticus]|nr:diguanylate cyclase [Vibrio parahaemolyticus]BCB43167.1 hypothetical protein Vag1382_22940 [Vibrio alginolyticus]BCB47768.1 hypothetical protein VagVIO5_22940 [Vibrio alginolyticus]BCB52370.1 hypothetical protein VagYM19_22970 [Vibrio alginolyticus]BCB56973.1 hypothetical protein VagYM4_22960 [Vibrio alginolyticus]